MFRFPWYLTLVSTNHASSNPGQVTNVSTMNMSHIVKARLTTDQNNCFKCHFPKLCKLRGDPCLNKPE